MMQKCGTCRWWLTTWIYGSATEDGPIVGGPFLGGEMCFNTASPLFHIEMEQPAPTEVGCVYHELEKQREEGS